MKLKQTILREYFKREDGGGSESQDSSSEEESNYLPSKSKGLFKEPKSWTRVRDLSQALKQRVTVFDMEIDLRSDKSLT